MYMNTKKHGNRYKLFEGYWREIVDDIKDDNGNPYPSPKDRIDNDWNNKHFFLILRT